VSKPSPDLPPSGDDWAVFHRLPPAERRVALILDRAADAALAAAADLLVHLAAGGYAVETAAGGAASLGQRLAAAEREPFARADYAGFFAALPRAQQDAVNARWGAPEADPAFRPGRLDCGALLVPTLRLGRVALAVRRDPAAAPPSHGDLALEAWLADGFRAHAVARIAAEGALSWAIGENLRPRP
jgi:cobaltochelatase CobN